MREKLLLESSDWPFLISTRTAKDYAENRAAEHFDRARTLCDWVDRSAPLSPAEEALLAAWEAEDCLFPEVIGLEGETIGLEQRGRRS
jgi:1,4-alpha-glucan branching enzyme